MRRVDLRERPVREDLTAEERKRITAVAGHLNARMRELIEDGLDTSEQIPAGAGYGVVWIRFPRLESNAAASRLRDSYQILAGPADGEGMLPLFVTECVCFEDMDYVQGAVMELLYE